MKNPTVALHPEGVDRNLDIVETFDDSDGSPSTRRAWIEIACASSASVPPSTVALHPEGVDRNKILDTYLSRIDRSPSTRRAWIEIIHRIDICKG